MSTDVATAPPPAEAASKRQQRPPLRTVRYERVPLALLEAHPANPRRFQPGDAGDDELLLSLIEGGQSTPAIVRELSPGRLQLLAGHRRWGAMQHAVKTRPEEAAKARLLEVECRIVEADDHRALLELVRENLQRRDLHWLDEARGVALLLGDGMRAEDVAGELGKSPSWVAMRAKLATIHPDWQRAVETGKGNHGDHVRGWPAVMLALIARHPQDVQRAMLDDWAIVRTSDAGELGRVIATRYTLLLKAAPWDLDDATLVRKSGACRACPKRSSCQTNLFEADTKGDRCTDRLCWGTKLAAHVQRREEELRQEHKDLVVLRSDVERHSPDKVPALSKREVSADDVVKVKAGTAGARPALDVATGEVVHVKATGYIGEKTAKLFGVKPGYQHEGRAAKAARAPGEKPEPKPAKERLEAHQKRRRVWALLRLVELLGGDRKPNKYSVAAQPEPADARVKRPPRGHLVALALAVGVKEAGYDWEKGLPKALALSEDAADEALWEEVRGHLIEKLGYQAAMKASTTGAELVCELTGVDWAAIRFEAQDALPLPKTLATIFNEDGTKRTDLKGRGAKKTTAAKAPKSTPEGKAAKAPAKAKGKVAPKAKAAKAGA